MNGYLHCPNGATVGAFGDTCAFSCKGGFELEGSSNGTCLAHQGWSGNPTCVAEKGLCYKVYIVTRLMKWVTLYE